ncbi:MAG: uracil-DNA glycosylase family protein [Lentimicrobiaceae bacterium]|nr:uracil-DNA glycosylase family protein [Lentimicrobiaceae bacterium]
MSTATIEKHPLPPFFPDNAKWLFLGSFPPKQQRWSMDFFYPNYQNDMWRIFGLVFFDDKNHFVNIPEKSFYKEKIIRFLTTQRIAMYDTAATVIRHKDNASDKDLEIIEAVDIGKIIQKLPDLQQIVATGQKALETLINHFAKKDIHIPFPSVGSHTDFVFENRTIRLFRMPSSSRAYPLSLEKKAEVYRKMF